MASPAAYFSYLSPLLPPPSLPFLHPLLPVHLLYPLNPHQPNPYQINWNSVASDLGTSNGHAARMRFYRFKSPAPPLAAPAKQNPKAYQGGESGEPEDGAGGGKTESKGMAEAGGLGEGSHALGHGEGGLEQGNGGFGRRNKGLGQGNVAGLGQGGGRVKSEPYVKLEPFIEPESAVKDELMDDAMDYEGAEESMVAGDAG